jgi:hypothetical protein
VPEIVGYLKTHLPAECDGLVNNCRRVLLHEFDLLGFQGLFFGPEMDWHADLVHNKRSPAEPWFQIPYLNPEVVGDHKIIWELNRQQHLVLLARGWRLTGESEFLAELEAQWRSWWCQNAYPVGINWASSLEVAFRSLSWVWIRQLVPSAAAPFVTEIDAALALSAGHIERYLSTYFAPNTHLLGEALALFVIGVVYPGLPGAGRWQAAGWKVLLEEAQRQTTPDGLHFERSTHYHVYAVDMLLHARLLASKNGLDIPAAFDERIQAMLELLAGITQTGVVPRMGDDDGGRLFDARRNRVEHMTDPLPIGASVYRRPDWKTVAPTLTEETVWLLGVKAAAAFTLMNPVPIDAPSAMPRSRAFPDAGIYVFVLQKRDWWQLTIDGGAHGVYGHCHADALSLQLSSRGEAWLIDPGTASYMEPEDRRYFRSARAHNTATLDGRNQLEDTGPFSWGPPPSVNVETWDLHEEQDSFVGTHNGFRPVIHRRSAIRERGAFRIRDEFHGSQGKHLVEIFWHFAPGLEVRMVDPGRIVATRPGGRSVTLLFSSPWKAVIKTGASSPAYGVKTASAELQLSHFGLLIPSDVQIMVEEPAEAQDSE